LRGSVTTGDADRADLPAPSTPTNSRRRLVRTPAAALYLNVPPAQLEMMRFRGNSCPFIKLGRSVYYDLDAVDEWLAKQVRKSTSDHGK
jgi:hypothetical protein